MYCIKNAGFCIALLFSFALITNPAHGDLIYTITGYANNLGDPNDPLLAPEVSAGETYVAEFMIDESIMDSDPDPGRGSYMGAIVSSSITFSGGYSSMVDFAGGEVVILQDIAGGAVGLNDPNGLGAILIGDLGNPFPSDELLTDPGTQIVGSPLSLWSLTEPTGLIVSFSDTGFGPSGSGTGPIVLTVGSAIPEPTTAGLLALSTLSALTRRRR